MDNIVAIAVAIIVPLVSALGAIYATRSQLKQAELTQGVEDRRAAGEHALDLAKFKRDVESDLWQTVQAELDKERQARRNLAELVEGLRMRISDLEDENRRLRADNMALTSELGRYTGRKL